MTANSIYVCGCLWLMNTNVFCSRKATLEWVHTNILARKLKLMRKWLCTWQIMQFRKMIKTTDWLKTAISCHIRKLRHNVESTFTRWWTKKCCPTSKWLWWQQEWKWIKTIVNLVLNFSAMTTWWTTIWSLGSLKWTRILV